MRSLVRAVVCICVSLSFPGVGMGAPFAYITNSHSDSVSVIDTVTNTVVKTVAVGNNPFGVAVHPNGSRVYSTNEFSNSVSVIDTATNAVVDTVAVEVPVSVAVHPNGSRVYVVNVFSNSVSVIDTATNAVVDTVAVGLAPFAFGKFIGPLAVRYPLDDGISRPFVTGAFGGSATDIKNSYKGHLGEDYRAIDGTPVYAFAAGQVCKVGSSSSWGNYVIVKHTLPDSTSVHSLYAHLQEAKQSQDANVPLGELIGLSGHTGGVPAHLHFGILDNKACDTGKGYSGKAFPETTESILTAGRTYFNPTIFIEKRK